MVDFSKRIGAKDNASLSTSYSSSDGELVDLVEDLGISTTSNPASQQRVTGQDASSSSVAFDERSQRTSVGPKAKLLFSKSHVYLHPSPFARDNVCGFLGLVEGSRDKPLLFWLPDELLLKLHEKEAYEKVEARTQTTAEPSDLEDEDGFVFVTPPPPKGEGYAFSVPLASVYSILVYPPSLTHWHGSATINLMGGVSLPSLFFHDDEQRDSPITTARHSSSRAQWGCPPFLATLEKHATLIRSRLIERGELWLVNPSRVDREVHEKEWNENAEAVPKGVRDRPLPEAESTIGTPPTQGTSLLHQATPYPPPPAFPSLRSLMDRRASTPRDAILTSLSNLTSLSRRTAQQILSHPLAQPVVPHLPPAVRSLITVPGEWERTASRSEQGGRQVATEFEAARVYLARWARVVAEEGERARRGEIAAEATISPAGAGELDPDLSSSMGVFDVVTASGSKNIPKPTRKPNSPISFDEWETFGELEKDEHWVRGEIFRRGTEEGRARREAWEVLFDVVPWSIGGFALDRDARRNEHREQKRAEYAVLRESWRAEKGDEARREEWHRIDVRHALDNELKERLVDFASPSLLFQVDCRRTDRNQPMFAVPEESRAQGNEEKEAGGAGSGDYGFEGEKEEEGGQAGLNPHIAALRVILMTYHTHSPALGYVQGMSDLLSPIYVVFEANEADAFWALVGMMKMMENNFLRDQSGMKRQLSTLQQLIRVMDPQLYAHLEKTDSLNLFFCFRWILIAFKREFTFNQVIRLWDVLFTRYYSNNFVIFVALAVLHSHRDVLIRYLQEFDEVLKYANDLTGTIDLDTTLAQAETLFLTFKELVDKVDTESTAASEAGISDELRSLLQSWESARKREFTRCFIVVH